MTLANPEKIEFRPLGLEDLDALIKIEKSSFPTPWSRASYYNELENHSIAHYWGCFLDDELIAFAGFWQIMEEGHIANVAVEPDFRGRGFGELLMRRLILACMELGGKRMTLEVRESNLIAQNLYNKLGFVSAGKRPHYYADGEDALILWLDL